MFFEGRADVELLIREALTIKDVQLKLKELISPPKKVRQGLTRAKLIVKKNLKKVEACENPMASVQLLKVI